MTRVLATIGDYLAIPLPDGRSAYGQYVYFHPLYATLVRILDIISSSEAPMGELDSAGDLFPPVFVGINVALRMKLWRIVGRAQPKAFVFPLFRCRQGLERQPGTYNDWLLWDGESYKRQGLLPVEYRGLEYLVGWSSDGLEKRIATGKNEPYAEME